MSVVEHSVELSLDARAAAAVTSMMQVLDDAGIPSIASSSPHVHPHVSLAVASTGSPEALAAALAGLADAADGLALSLSALGVFVAPARVVYLAVAVTEPLLALNRRVHEQLDAGGIATRALYRVGAWVPHCTLAMHVGAPGDAVTLLADAALPLEAIASSVRIVEVPTGKVRATVR